MNQTSLSAIPGELPPRGEDFTRFMNLLHESESLGLKNDYDSRIKQFNTLFKAVFGNNDYSGYFSIILVNELINEAQNLIGFYFDWDPLQHLMETIADRFEHTDSDKAHLNDPFISAVLDRAVEWHLYDSATRIATKLQDHIAETDTISDDDERELRLKLGMRVAKIFYIKATCTQHNELDAQLYLDIFKDYIRQLGYNEEDRLKKLEDSVKNHSNDAIPFINYIEKKVMPKKATENSRAVLGIYYNVLQGILRNSSKKSVRPYVIPYLLQRIFECQVPRISDAIKEEKVDKALEYTLTILCCLGGIVPDKKADVESLREEHLADSSEPLMEHIKKSVKDNIPKLTSKHFKGQEHRRYLLGYMADLVEKCWEALSEHDAVCGELLESAALHLASTLMANNEDEKQTGQEAVDAARIYYYFSEKRIWEQQIELRARFKDAVDRARDDKRKEIIASLKLSSLGESFDEYSKELRNNPDTSDHDNKFLKLALAAIDTLKESKETEVWQKLGYAVNRYGSDMTKKAVLNKLVERKKDYSYAAFNLIAMHWILNHEGSLEGALSKDALNNYLSSSMTTHYNAQNIYETFVRYFGKKRTSLTERLIKEDLIRWVETISSSYNYPSQQEFIYPYLGLLYVEAGNLAEAEKCRNKYASEKPKGCKDLPAFTQLTKRLMIIPRFEDDNDCKHKLKGHDTGPTNELYKALRSSEHFLFLTHGFEGKKNTKEEPLTAKDIVAKYRDRLMDRLTNEKLHFGTGKLLYQYVFKDKFCGNHTSFGASDTEEKWKSAIRKLSSIIKINNNDIRAAIIPENYRETIQINPPDKLEYIYRTYWPSVQSALGSILSECEDRGTTIVEVSEVKVSKDDGKLRIEVISSDSERITSPTEIISQNITNDKGGHAEIVKALWGLCDFGLQYGDKDPVQILGNVSRRSHDTQPTDLVYIIHLPSVGKATATDKATANGNNGNTGDKVELISTYNNLQK